MQPEEGKFISGEITGKTEEKHESVHFYLPHSHSTKKCSKKKFLYRNASFARSRKKGRRRKNAAVEKTKLRRVPVRIAVCCSIAVAFFCIKYLDTPFTKSAMSWLSATLTYDMDFSEPFGQLQFVQNLFPGAVSVFQENENNYLNPMSESNQVEPKVDETGLIFEGKEQEKILACASGRVIKRGINEEHGNYIEVSQEDGYQMFYYSLGESPLKEGDLVKQGDEIGTLKSNTLYLVLEKNGVEQAMEGRFSFTEEE